jgi:hypothetical protein
MRIIPTNPDAGVKPPDKGEHTRELEATRR